MAKATDPIEPTTAPNTPLPVAAAPHPTWYRPFSWAAFGIGAASFAVLVALLGGGIAIGFAISHHDVGRMSPNGTFQGPPHFGGQGGFGQNGTGQNGTGQNGTGQNGHNRNGSGNSNNSNGSNG